MWMNSEARDMAIIVLVCLVIFVFMGWLVFG